MARWWHGHSGDLHPGGAVGSQRDRWVSLSMVTTASLASLLKEARQYVIRRS
jgi:hypothetical protein